MSTAGNPSRKETKVRDAAKPARPEPASLLRGDVIACACPDCGSPMSVRLWLMSADCWRCMTSITLSLEEIEALREAASDTNQTGKTAVAPLSTRQAEPPAQPNLVSRQWTARDRAPGRLATLPIVAPDPRDRLRLEPVLDRPLIAPTVERNGVAALQEPLLSSGGLHDLLAWLISAIIHLLLMIILGLLAPPVAKEDEPHILLSLDINQTRQFGELPNRHASIIVPDFDLPIPKRPTNQRERNALQMADEDAREIRLDPDAPVRTLPDLTRVHDDLLADDPYRRMHATRDPRVRSTVVRREGGTTMTEAAVARALRWLARHQHDDGSWRICAFHKAPGCRGRCGNRGSIESPVGGTGLALQPFLGAGQTHHTGIYREVVSYGLQYLIQEQRPDGDLRGKSSDNAGMYVHAQAAIVLCDAYKMTGDEALRGPAQKAIDFIGKAQHSAGGWRYRPRQSGDTSVIGWQLMALHSARSAHLDLPDKVLHDAGRYLDRAQVDDDGALYAYQPGGSPTPAMTAEGLLSRMYLGWDKHDPGLRRGVLFLATRHLPDWDDPNVYYWYYATQVMHHWGGRPWEEWNMRMRDVLVSAQETAGHEAGSWAPVTPHGHQGGRLYMTALTCCTLEVYYRHAPLFRKIDLGEATQ